MIGGLIRPEKSFAYLILFTFEKLGKYKFESALANNRILTVQNKIGVRQ